MLSVAFCNFSAVDRQLVDFVAFSDSHAIRRRWLLLLLMIEFDIVFSAM